MTIFEDFSAVLAPLFDGRFWKADEVPDDAEYPFGSLALDTFPSTATLLGDARTTAYARSCQVSVWQLIGQDSDSLPKSARSALNGLRLDRAEGRLRCHVAFSLRVPQDRPSNAVLDAITVRFAELG